MHPPLLPSFRLGDVDHAVVGFDVTRRDGEQLIDPYTGAPQHPQHDIVARAALVSRLEHLIDLLLFKVVGDVLHALPKMRLIGNNGCDFERDSSSRIEVQKTSTKRQFFVRMRPRLNIPNSRGGRIAAEVQEFISKGLLSPGLPSARLLAIEGKQGPF